MAALHGLFPLITEARHHTRSLLRISVFDAARGGQPEIQQERRCVVVPAHRWYYDNCKLQPSAYFGAPEALFPIMSVFLYLVSFLLFTSMDLHLSISARIVLNLSTIAVPGTEEDHPCTSACPSFANKKGRLRCRHGGMSQWMTRAIDSLLCSGGFTCSLHFNIWGPFR